MGQVTVPVNGRSFTILCDDGQEVRIRRLAQYVDAKVAEFVGTVGQVGEARLLLLAALVIADELSDANDTLDRERSRAQAASAERAVADATADGIQGVAKRVEAIAAHLETP
jgi:cell division protein ZapA